jgi:uncharacterized protein (TIGR02172 family)
MLKGRGKQMKYGKIIGIGNTAAVYEWEESKVLKLFYEGYSKEAVEKEFRNAKAVENMYFPKPKAYEIIHCQGRMGIIYEAVIGESLLHWVMRTNNVQECAAYMAKLHKSMIKNSISNVPCYKEFLKYNILEVPAVDSKKREEVLQILDKLPDGNTLCHGDFHPDNIILSDGQTMVIDFMNVCHGNFLYDVARTVYLMEFTPVPKDIEDKEKLLQFKKTLADLYLMQMNVTREMLKDYLSVIAFARLGECPNEQF